MDSVHSYLNPQIKLRRFTLLFVDDSKIIREQFLESIAPYFKKAFYAKDGEEALKIYEKQNIDIIITDINMPIKGGIELTEDIREIDPMAVVLLLTTDANRDLLLKAIELDIDGFILKPIDASKIIKSISRSVEKLVYKDELIHSNNQLKLDVKNKLELIKTQEEDMEHRSRMADMGDMLAMIAHQLKQPLSAISGSTQLCSLTYEISGKIDGDMLERGTNDIVKAVDFMSETIDTFKHYFSPTVKYDTVDICEVIDTTLQFLSHDIKHCSIDIANHIDKDIFLKIDKNYLIQVFLNIFKNSIDVFKQKKIKTPMFVLNSNITADYITIDISDNAGGIPSEIIDTLFDRYQTFGKKDGTGLGLFMSKNIMKKYFNGDISVSNENGGAKFTLFIDRKYNA